MNNLEMIDDIFYKTNSLFSSYSGTIKAPQIDHIISYLIATVACLKGREEAEKFKENWDNTKSKIEDKITEKEWEDKSHLIKINLEDALKEKDMHNPNPIFDKNNRSLFNLGIEYFYKNTFLRMYGEVKMECED